jgi:hypothetical protein
MIDSAVMEASLCFGFPKSEWKSLNIKLGDDDEDAWSQAIGIFERRIRERFLSCIDALIKADTKSELPPESQCSEICTPGFSIMALCCLLIETLQGFREQPPPGIADEFKSFLLRPAFADTFRDDAIASRFVSGIRNGILHEAETRRWVIWRDEPVNQIVAPEDDGFALNRSLFYKAVKEEFDLYLRDLGEPSNKLLRDRL